MCSGSNMSYILLLPKVFHSHFHFPEIAENIQLSSSVKSFPILCIHKKMMHFSQFFRFIIFSARRENSEDSNFYCIRKHHIIFGVQNYFFFLGLKREYSRFRDAFSRIEIYSFIQIQF